jgi:hypothetical protein
MQTLLDRAFRHLSGAGAGSSVFLLSQAMGGGKTHSMIALGLLARDPTLPWKLALPKSSQEHQCGEASSGERNCTGLRYEINLNRCAGSTVAGLGTLKQLNRGKRVRSTSAEWPFGQYIKINRERNS